MVGGGGDKVLHMRKLCFLSVQSRLVSRAFSSAITLYSSSSCLRRIEPDKYNHICAALAAGFPGWECLSFHFCTNYSECLYKKSHAEDEKDEKYEFWQPHSSCIDICISEFWSFTCHEVTQLLVRSAQIFTAPRGWILQDFVMCWNSQSSSCEDELWQLHFPCTEHGKHTCYTVSLLFWQREHGCGFLILFINMHLVSRLWRCYIARRRPTCEEWCGRWNFTAKIRSVKKVGLQNNATKIPSFVNLMLWLVKMMFSLVLLHLECIDVFMHSDYKT